MIKKEHKIEPVDIIVVTYRRPLFIKEFIEKLEERTQYPYRLIVIDNGSDDKTKEWLLEQLHKKRIWKLTFNSKNEFLSTCFTRGLELVESRLFITTQDDLLPPATRHHWLAKMVELIDEHQDYTTISMKYLNAFWDTYIRRKKHGK